MKHVQQSTLIGYEAIIFYAWHINVDVSQVYINFTGTDYLNFCEDKSMIDILFLVTGDNVFLTFNLVQEISIQVHLSTVQSCNSSVATQT